MKLKAIQLRKGNMIMFNNEPYLITEFMHITPGKGQAIIQTKLKSVKSGTNAETRFRPDEGVEKVDLENREMEYLYDDDTFFHFMDNQTFEQVPISREFIGENAYFLLPNTKVQVSFHDTTPMGVELPLTVELRVTETEPIMKTATITSSYKPAVMETGLRVQVPQFIEEGELLRIDTRDGKYLERVK